MMSTYLQLFWQDRFCSSCLEIFRCLSVLTLCQCHPVRFISYIDHLKTLGMLFIIRSLIPEICKFFLQSKSTDGIITEPKRDWNNAISAHLSACIMQIRELYTFGDFRLPQVPLLVQLINRQHEYSARLSH